jgi:hypothetical protein
VSSKYEFGKNKSGVTLPSIVLSPDLWEEDEDEAGEEAANEPDYSYSTSPLYHELMGMMQDRAAFANSISTPNSNAPASAGFQLDPAWSASGAPRDARDSQLTIRYDPRRDSNRDSSASYSTITHATIVRGASIVRRVRADVVTTAPSIATFKGKERECERPPVQVVQEDEEDGSSSDDATSSDECDEDDTSRSPAGTPALTSAPNSQEDAGGSKSPRLDCSHGSPLPSPSPSLLRASFPESGSGELEQVREEEECPYATPPPSAPVVPVCRPPIAITTNNLENPGAASSLISIPKQQAKERENGIVPPSFSSTKAARYPAWLAAIVLPLAEFIDDAADPHALFTDLQEIAQGESGSVYSAYAAPSVVQQFQPLSPRSPTKDCIESVQVAIKRVPLVRGGTAKLVDLRRELELARALHHANVLRMERLYVDVADESLWIGMELMDRSLADVLAVVGEESEEGAGAPVMISEKMVARFVWDVSGVPSFLFLFLLLADWDAVTFRSC